MSNKKLTINQLKIQSFVISDDSFDAGTIKGGREHEVSVREVYGGCWVSEVGGPDSYQCHRDIPEASNGDDTGEGG